MIKKRVPAILMLFLASSAMAQNTCTALADAVEWQLKNAAQNRVEGIGDNSAPRAALREAKTANSLALIQLNLQLMVINKCPARTKPLDPNFYFGDAAECSTQLLRGNKDTAACNLKDWKGLGTSSEGKGTAG